MNISRTPIRNLLTTLAAPLVLASYLAWFAVWVSVTGRLGLPGEGFGLIADVLLLVFLAAWLACLLLEESGPPLLLSVALVVLAGSALALIGLGRSGTSPILLILVATMLVSQFRPLGIVLTLVAINATFVALMIWRWEIPVAWLLPTVLAYGAFQVFAVLVMSYAEEARRSADELRQVNANLLATRALLSETARDQERLRLSRELHDVAGHKLTALKLNLRRLSRQPDQAGSKEIQVAEQLASELLDELRAVSRQLRTHDGIDMREGIRELARPLPRPRLEIDIEPGLRVPLAEQAEALLRMVQEGLTNIARHSGADRAWLKLYRADDQLVLELSDNGACASGRTPEPGNGLTGMRERLEALGGRLIMQQTAQGGLKLVTSLPLERA